MRVAQGLLAAAAVWLSRGLIRKTASRRWDLSSKVVLISGGSRGLGLALARRFSRLGALPAICARNEESLSLIKQEFEAQGKPIHVFACDVSDPERVRAWISSVIERFGRIDILVNNAGIIQVGPASAMRPDDFHAAIDTIFYGTVNSTREALPELTKGRGRIINITSIGGIVALPHLLPYTCAKFAMSGFSLALAAELRHRGILVTTVVPGLMRTGSYLNALFKGRREAEFDWFSLAATLPGVSMSAERAVNKIIEAAREGRPFVTIGFPAKVLRLVHALLPGFWVRFMSGVDRWLLPESSGPTDKPGRNILVSARPFSRHLMKLGRKAARQYRQAG
ncbi:MAG TPA: SDR family oxidoreductase [Bdellovibrionota bacterium]|nr:SDR family oxidoreductase [Bdellovibrionota bacterium]